MANPADTVEVNGESYEAIVTPLAGEERDRVFARIAEDYAFFNDHQAGGAGRFQWWRWNDGKHGQLDPPVTPRGVPLAFITILSS